MTTLCAICGDNEPAPVICQHCETRVRRDLDTIARLRARFDPRPSGTKPGGKAPGKPGSKPPANLDVISATDLRTRPVITDDGSHHPDDVPRIDAEIVALARMVIEEHRLSHPLRDTFDGLRILHLHFDWLVRHHAVEEHAAILADMAAACVLVARDFGSPRIGTCNRLLVAYDAECGGPLRLAWHGSLPTDPAAHCAPTHVVCGWCADAWPIDAATMAGMLRAVDTGAKFPVSKAWLCREFNVTDVWVRKWVMRGEIRRYSDGQVNLVDVLRLLDTRNAEVLDPSS